MKIHIDKKILCNALGFQLTWLVCVQGNGLYALLVALLFIMLNQRLFNLTNVSTAVGLLLFSVIGYLGDSLLAYLFDLNYYQQLGVFAPIWLLALWLAFAMTLNYSMKWIFSSLYLTVAIGLLLVPLSYIAGITLSGSYFNDANHLSFLVAEGMWWAAMLLAYRVMQINQEVQHA